MTTMKRISPQTSREGSVSPKPIKLCECGCGQETRVADRTWAKYGMVKGKPLRYAKGHNNGIGHKSLKERLVAYSVRKGECLEWVGALRAEYGAITVEGKVKRAHRVAYEEFVGPIPDGVLVLHECDNTVCIEPSHLFLGTHQNNSDDKVAKGRQARGEGNAKAKLTPEKVKAIRRYAVTHSYQNTADFFSVHKSTVTDIQNGRTWKHVK
jgi:HNH endonuclease